MNNKKLVITFILVSMLLIGIIPSINTLKNKDKENPTGLFNTDSIESMINYFAFDKLNISMVTDNIIVGKNGFLYLGNIYNNTIRKTQNFYKYKDSDIDEWTDVLKDLQTWYESRGIKFVFVIAPNKHTIYPEYLPDWIEPKGGNLTDKIFQSAHEKDINMLDIRPALIDEKKNKELLYLKLDSHWNRLGASIAFNQTIEYLNKKYKTNITTPSYSFTYPKNYVGGSDLASLLKIKSRIAKNHEKEIMIKFKDLNQICLGDIDNKSFEMLTCKLIKTPRFTITDKSKYTTNQNASNNINLMMVADSFATSNSQLYSKTFENVWKFHHNRLQGKNLIKIVDKFQPSVVIYQIVERNFYHLNLFNSVSEINVVENKLHANSNKIFDLLDKQFKYVKNNHFKLQDRQLLVNKEDPNLVLKHTHSTAGMVLLKIQIESPHDTRLQLFYKKKKNAFYSEKNSFVHPIKKGANNIMIEIPAKYINQELRVDIVNTVGNYQLKEFSIFDLK